MNFNDCSSVFDGQTLQLQNDLIYARFNLSDGVLVCETVINKQSGYEWKNSNGATFISVPHFPFNQASVTATQKIDDNDGLSEPSLLTQLAFSSPSATVYLRLSLYPNLPFIRSEIALSGKFGGVVNIADESNDGNENKKKVSSFPDTAHLLGVGFDQKHIKYTQATFFDATDANNDLVITTSGTIYTNANQKFSGDLFVFDSYLNGEGLLVAKESPTTIARLGDNDYNLLITRDGCIYLVGCSLSFNKEFTIDESTPLYSAVLGVGKAENLLTEFKKYYLYGATAIKNEPVYITSNTWGDRSRDTALCEEFIMRELDKAKELGVQVLQIDDGWQKGITENSGVASGGVALGVGIYDTDANFWTPRPDRFPNGLEPLCKKASDLGVKLGLWYSCDSTNDYANYMRDVENLLALHQKYGVTYFKLDGTRLNTTKSAKNLTALLKTAYKMSGGKIHFQLDITAGKRHGYFFEREFGNLFVENRYTDWGNYYPHRTFRNLWNLCRYIPSQKLQFEFLNPRRNQQVYALDPLAPNNYGLDYIFASVMFSNPLCWMEMTNLDKDDILAVKPIVEIFKDIAPEITNSIVEPIGNEPDGTSFSGLVAQNYSGGYALLFRELTTKNEFTFALPNAVSSLTTLYSSDGASVTLGEKSVTLKAEKPRSFALVKYEIND